MALSHDGGDQWERIQRLERENLELRYHNLTLLDHLSRYIVGSQPDEDHKKGGG